MMILGRGEETIQVGVDYDDDDGDGERILLFALR